MQAIAETLFDIVYLTTVITLGVRMIRGCKGNPQFRLFGIMAVVLGSGDSFHLVPGAVALCTTGLENYTAALGIGKLVTSVTMTIFSAPAWRRVAVTRCAIEIVPMLSMGLNSPILDDIPAAVMTAPISKFAPPVRIPLPRRSAGSVLCNSTDKSTYIY